MSVPGPTLGPCEAWIDGDAVAACPPCDNVTTDTSILDDLAVEASMLLYEISGRRFTGLCDKTVRPCKGGCSCWDPARWYGGYGFYGDWYWGGHNWCHQSGPTCGCGALSSVPLAGYPVREITEVKIDGVVLDALDANTNPNWRLDGWDELVRMDDPSTTVTKRYWPACQNLSLDDTEAGTWSITYRHGIDPPQIGRDAAAALACQLWLDCSGAAGECLLPGNVTKETRQGITIDRRTILDWLNGDGSTGIITLDSFLRAYGGRHQKRRAPAVWSPDLQAYPRRMVP